MEPVTLDTQIQPRIEELTITKTSDNIGLSWTFNPRPDSMGWETDYTLSPHVTGTLAYCMGVFDALDNRGRTTPETIAFSWWYKGRPQRSLAMLQAVIFREILRGRRKSTVVQIWWPVSARDQAEDLAYRYSVARNDDERAEAYALLSRNIDADKRGLSRPVAPFIGEPVTWEDEQDR